MLLIAPTAIVFLGAFLLVCLAELLVTAWYAWRAAAGAGKAAFLDRHDAPALEVSC